MTFLRESRGAKPNVIGIELRGQRITAREIEMKTIRTGEDAL